MKSIKTGSMNHIFELIKKLKKKGRNDLTELLIGCRSSIEETDQYGSYWNKFLSSFIIYAPKKKYQQLENLTEGDREIIKQSILEMFPKSEESEIGFLCFRILSNEEQINKNKELANSWLKRAKNKLEEGKKLIKELRYPEAISAFQECIELSIKSIFLLLEKCLLNPLLIPLTLPANQHHFQDI